MQKTLRERAIAFIMVLAMLLPLVSVNSFAANDTELKAGWYNITANLYVPGELNTVLPGVTAYLTDTVVPPTTPAHNNATLQVEENGDKTLVIDTLNATFTLQSIGNASNATIVDTKRDNVNYAGKNGRITELKIKLLDTTGQYKFTDCQEYPTLLQQDWNVPLTLDVDFASAQLQYTPSETQSEYTLENDTQAVAVTIQSTHFTTDDLKKMSLSVEQPADTTELQSKLTEMYDATPEFQVYNISTDTDLIGNTQAVISVKTEYTQAAVYKITDGELSELTSSISDNHITFTDARLGTYVILNTTNNYKIEKITYPTIDQVSYTLIGSRRYLHKTVDLTGYTAVKPKIEDMNGATAYTLGFYADNGYLENIRTNNGKKNGEDSEPIALKMQVPAQEGQKAWFITKNSLSGVCTAEELTAEYKDGSLNITVAAGTFNQKTNKAYFTTFNPRLKAMAQYLKGTTGENTDWGYVLITDKTVKNMPTVSASNLKNVCTGNEIKPWSSTNNPDSITISGTTAATIPGQYQAVYELPEGNNCWGDGTTENKTIEWEITKATLTAKYVEKITEGQTPTGTVEITRSGSKLDDGDYTFYGIDKERDLPVISIPEQEYKVGIYSLDSFKPTLKEGALVSDYFEWAPFETGTLYVFPASAGEQLGTKLMYPVPENGKTYTYTGDTITGIDSSLYGSGVQVTEDSIYEARDVGTYTCTLKITNQNTYWSDGTQEDKVITWSIEKKQTPTTPTNPDKDKTQTVTANLYLDGKYNTVLPGITVYLNNPDNPIKGTGAPTVPQSDNATLTTTSDGDMLLTLDLPNPVFTLQKIGGGSNASIENTETSRDLAYASGVKGKRDSRISQVTFKLNDKSGEYTFDDCEEFPTALNPDSNWTNPLVLKVQFKGGTDSSLDSNKNVDTGKVSGGTTVPTVKTDLTVKVKDDTATVSKINTDDLSSKNSITLDVTDGNKGVTGVNLPVSALEKIVDAKVPGTTLTLSDTSASFDLAALSAVTKAADKTVDLRILTGADAEKKLSAAQKTAMQTVKNASAVHVALSSDDKAITDLGAGKLTVSVPYTWDGKGAVRAYQTDENGKLVSVPVSCKNNVAVLTLTQPGSYILGTVDAKAFDDVKDDAFYKAAVDWAVENGVTSGISDTLFAPDATCTRAQVVTFLWRAAGSPEPTKTENIFTDVKSDAYYYKAVLWALEKGITSGTSATTFAPDATVSRAQTVTFQWRMAGSPKADGSNAFTDVPADSYYKDAVLWASKNGVTSGTSATTFAPENGCTRGQIVTFLYRQMNK